MFVGYNPSGTGPSARGVALGLCELDRFYCCPSDCSCCAVPGDCFAHSVAVGSYCGWHGHSFGASATSLAVALRLGKLNRSRVSALPNCSPSCSLGGVLVLSFACLDFLGALPSHELHDFIQLFGQYFQDIVQRHYTDQATSSIDDR